MSKDVAGNAVSAEDVACYRLYAANCIEIAEHVADIERRVFLLRMAQAWGKLADQVEKIPEESSANGFSGPRSTPGQA
jgi:hypothetical protein